MEADDTERSLSRPTRTRCRLPLATPARRDDRYSGSVQPSEDEDLSQAVPSRHIGAARVTA
jgi:hypothetical protein